MKQAFRYITLLLGFALGIYLIIINYENPGHLVMQIAVMLLWLILPLYIFFFISSRNENQYYIIIPSILLLLLYAYITYDYLTSESSTSALGLAVAPFLGILILGVGYLTAWVVTLIVKKEIS